MRNNVDPSIRLMAPFMRSGASYDACVDALRTFSVDAVLGSSHILAQYTTQPCDLSLTGTLQPQGYFSFPISVSSQLQALRSGVNIAGDMSWAVASLLETGAIAAVESTYLNTYSSVCSSGSAIGATRLTFTDFIGIYYTCGALILISFLLLLLECLMYRRRFMHSPFDLYRRLNLFLGYFYDEAKVVEREDDDMCALALLAHVDAAVLIACATTGSLPGEVSGGTAESTSGGMATTRTMGASSRKLLGMTPRSGTAADLRTLMVARSSQQLVPTGGGGLHRTTAGLKSPRRGTSVEARGNGYVSIGQGEGGLGAAAVVSGERNLNPMAIGSPSTAATPTSPPVPAIENNVSSQEVVAVNVRPASHAMDATPTAFSPVAVNSRAPTPDHVVTITDVHMHVSDAGSDALAHPRPRPQPHRALAPAMDADTPATIDLDTVPSSALVPIVEGGPKPSRRRRDRDTVPPATDAPTYAFPEAALPTDATDTAGEDPRVRSSKRSKRRATQEADVGEGVASPAGSSNASKREPSSSRRAAAAERLLLDTGERVSRVGDLPRAPSTTREPRARHRDRSSEPRGTAATSGESGAFTSRVDMELERARTREVLARAATMSNKRTAARGVLEA